MDTTPAHPTRTCFQQLDQGMTLWGVLVYHCRRGVRARDNQGVLLVSPPPPFHIPLPLAYPDQRTFTSTHVRMGYAPLSALTRRRGTTLYMFVLGERDADED
jgi:hypothetical protein